MITSTSKQQKTLTPDMTPLLDLIFIVLVFLLLTTNIQVKTMEVSIPHTDDSEVLASLDRETLTINILDQKSLWAIEGESYTDWNRFTVDLLAQIKEQPNKMLIIATDRSAPVEAMLKLLAFLQKNQITATNIMMDDQQQ